MNHVSAKVLEHCTVAVLLQCTNTTNETLPGATNCTLDHHERRLAGVLEIYITFLEHLGCTEEEVDSILRQHSQHHQNNPQNSSSAQTSESKLGALLERYATVKMFVKLKLTYNFIKQAETRAEADGTKD